MLCGNLHVSVYWRNYSESYRDSNATEDLILTLNHWA